MNASFPPLLLVDIIRSAFSNLLGSYSPGASRTLNQQASVGMAPITDGPELDAEPSQDTFALDSSELNKQPEDVFEVVCKLGEGSYGAVHMAIHKSSNHTLAIKMVPVDTELQEIMKEIRIMQQCDSRYVVKYYGSYFKNSDLWIVMEYCGAGSISDIMRLRRKTLNELEIAAVLRDTLKGLRYLHNLKKIHRDIKAGNILLTLDGHAKLADFGVAGQLTDTMAKRNTVIGTPFWMAPEVIEEIGYDTKADIWSLGITAIEAAEGRPPYAEIHPMRAIFMIPTKPPPTLKNPEEWSHEFNDFVLRCLVKKPDERATAAELLEHPFITSAPVSNVLEEMIADAKAIAEANNLGMLPNDDTESGTMIHNTGEMASWINEDNATLVEHPTMVGFQTAQSLRKHMFDLMIGGTPPNAAQKGRTNGGHFPISGLEALRQNSDALGNVADRSLSAIGAPSDTFASSLSSQTLDSPSILHRALHEEKYDLLHNLSLEELIRCKNELDSQMDKDLQELRHRYQLKRQPILDAIDEKKNKRTL